jgi:hypothetical protein
MRRMPQVTALNELSFVRASMRALEDRRSGCADCHRTPLVGETVFFFGERVVCELCRPLRRGVPTGSEVVHSAERDLTVKRRFAA